MCTAESLVCSCRAWIQAWGLLAAALPSQHTEQCRADCYCSHKCSAPDAKGICGVWAIRKQTPFQTGNLLGIPATEWDPAWYADSSVMEFKRGSAEYSSSIPV